MCIRRSSATFDLKEIKEASTLEVEGCLSRMKKQPNGIEIRMKKVKILSQPEEEMMPLGNFQVEIKHFSGCKVKLSFHFS